MYVNLLLTSQTLFLVYSFSIFQSSIAFRYRNSYLVMESVRVLSIGQHSREDNGRVQRVLQSPLVLG